MLIFCCFQDLILSYPFDSRVFPQDFACLDSDDISDKPFVYAALWDYDNYTALFAPEHNIAIELPVVIVGRAAVVFKPRFEQIADLHDKGRAVLF